MCAYVPGNVCIKRRHWWVESLVSAYEEVLVDLPDLAVLVPGLQVGLQVGRVCRHAGRYGRLDLTHLLILLYRGERREGEKNERGGYYEKKKKEGEIKRREGGKVREAWMPGFYTPPCLALERKTNRGKGIKREGIGNTGKRGKDE